MQQEYILGLCHYMCVNAVCAGMEIFYTSIYEYVCMRVCTYICMYVGMCVCMRVYECRHIHTFVCRYIGRQVQEGEK